MAPFTSATPTTGGQITHTERALIPDPFDAYVRFNPESYKSLWRPFQPTGPLVFQELPAEVQMELTNELYRKVAEYMGEAILTGDKAAGTFPYDRFNGLVYRLDNDADVSDVASPLTLTSSNIVGELTRGYKQVPSVVRKNPNFKIFMSDTTLHHYFEAITDLTANKGVDPTSTPESTFWRKPIIPLVGFPDNAFLMTYSSFDETSNLWLGVDWQYEDFTQNIRVDRVQLNSEEYFMKMKMKADTQIVWGEHCVWYKA